MTTASDETWRRRVEHCCVELGDGLYRRPMLSPWPVRLLLVVIASVAIGYFYGGPSEYKSLLERASKHGASALFLVVVLGLPWAVRLLLLPPAYLLLRRGRVSGVWLKKLVSWTVVAVLIVALPSVLWCSLAFSRSPIPSWLAGIFLASLLAVVVTGILFEPLASLLLRRGEVHSPWFRALAITVCPDLEPVVRVDGQTLTLGLAAGKLFWWPPPIQAPLASLRSVALQDTEYHAVVLKFADERIQALSPRYSPPIFSRVAEFLRRKLPAPVELTADELPFEG